MLARVAHQLRRRVEAHRLTVQKRRRERRRVMALQPRAGVGQQRETGRVTFRKAVPREPLDLREHLLREMLGVSVGQHALRESLAELRQLVAAPLPRRDGPPQLIGLPRREARRHHGQRHGLLLEQRHAKRASKHALDARIGIGDRLLSCAPSQVGMHHVALNGPGPHDGHLHHQVVEAPRLQARQHAHLRAALDLEHPHRVGAAQHVVGGGVFGWNVVEGQRTGFGARLIDKIEALANAGEHAQRQHIHLHQAHRIQVVLVPLDDGARIHGRGADGHDLVQAPLAHHEAAHMLRQVTRKAFQLRCHAKHARLQLVERLHRHRLAMADGEFGDGVVAAHGAARGHAPIQRSFGAGLDFSRIL